MLIRDATPEDIPAISALVNSIYDYEWPTEWYMWQCFENPYETVFKIALEGDLVVGMFGMIVKKVAVSHIIGDCTWGTHKGDGIMGFRVAQVVWINTRSDYRGRDIFSRLYEHCRADLKVDAMCIIANKAGLDACKRIGMYHIGSMERLVLDADDASTVRPPIEDYQQTPHNVLQFSRPDSRWRFSKHPVYTYVSLQAGVTVYTKRYEEYVDIVSYPCLKIKRDTDLLFSEVIDSFGGGKFTTWANPSLPHYPVLKRMGFKESGHKNYFAMAVFNQSAKELYDYERWHLVQADATNY